MVATNVIASRPSERRLTWMPTTRANWMRYKKLMQHERTLASLDKQTASDKLHHWWYIDCHNLFVRTWLWQKLTTIDNSGLWIFCDILRQNDLNWPSHVYLGLNPQSNIGELLVNCILAPFVVFCLGSITTVYNISLLFIVFIVFYTQQSEVTLIMFCNL